MCLITTEDLCYWEHFISLCNLMYRTVTVPIDSINILHKNSLNLEVKILYNFMDEIL